MKVITRKLEIVPQYDLRSICPLEEMLLFDIETTGLKKETTQLYLVGCAYYEDGCWMAKQWLTEYASDEEDVLTDFFQFASKFNLLITFNGAGFDIPYMQYKSEYYMTGFDIAAMESLDIYKYAKKARKFLGVKSMSQKSVEEFLGIYREDQLDGGRLIPVYYDYEKTGSEELERLLLLHNFDDVQGMLKILPIMSYADGLDGGYEFKSIEECMDTVVLEMKLNHPVPVYCENTPDKKGWEDIVVCMDNDLLQINIKLHREVGKFPLENIGDYYYLPDEDRVIHKDVAEFIERSRRKKATRNNCFLKKEGSFMVCACESGLKEYRLDGDKKRRYIDLEDVYSCQDKEIYMRLAAGIMSIISCC